MFKGGETRVEDLDDERTTRSQHADIGVLTTGAQEVPCDAIGVAECAEHRGDGWGHELGDRVGGQLLALDGPLGLAHAAGQLGVAPRHDHGAVQGRNGYLGPLGSEDGDPQQGRGVLGQMGAESGVTCERDGQLGLADAPGRAWLALGTCGGAGGEAKGLQEGHVGFRGGGVAELDGEGEGGVVAAAEAQRAQHLPLDQLLGGPLHESGVQTHQMTSQRHRHR